MLKRLSPLRAATLTIALALGASLPARLLAAPLRPQIDVTGYVINADLDPGTSRLTARTAVTFTALDDLTSVTFELNNGLQITKATDQQGKPLQSDRLATNSSVRFTPNTPIPKGTTTTFTLEYTGALTGSDTSPVEGIKMAAIADPISMLLYPGAWFPISIPGLYTDRFTSELHVTVPADEKVIASGYTGTKPLPNSRVEYDFNWTKPGFPGAIIAGKFAAPISVPGAPNIKVYVTDARKKATPNAPLQFGQTASRQLEYMTSVFGPMETPQLNIVELPDDAVSASWAPEVVAIAGQRIADPRNASRLLANTIAHQWWGSEVSPATLNDAWITNGMSRYAELMTLEDSAGQNAFKAAISDVSAGALAYDTEPLSSLGRLDPFSPQFQSMTLEKGAMIYHMLRWEMGDDVFKQFLRGVLSQYKDQGVRTSQVQEVAEAQSHLQLTAFFAQWVDGTGAPSFKDKYTVFRLGSSKGFRTVGALEQDLDLFRMPVELRIETDGKTEDRRVDLSGTESQFSVETFGRPRRTWPCAWLCCAGRRWWLRAT
jgi:aminopeptidase N